MAVEAEMADAATANATEVKMRNSVARVVMFLLLSLFLLFSVSRLSDLNYPFSGIANSVNSNNNYFNFSSTLHIPHLLHYFRVHLTR
ncbi:hypothetical protein WN943_002870 [Citrus x changshan-huyou]